MKIVASTHSILFKPTATRAGCGIAASLGATEDECSADIVIEYDGKISKDRYGDAAAVLSVLAGEAFHDAINTHVAECMAVINAAHEDKIKELELNAERWERRRDLAESCEHAMERVCAQQGNEILRLEGKL